MKLAGLCAAVWLSGCATLAPGAHRQGLRIEWDAKGASNFVETDKHWREVLQETLALLSPADLAKEAVQRVEIQPTPAPSGAEKIADFHFEPAGATTLWFAEYASSAQKAYCWWQVPLTWLTLGLWQVVVPSSWPCVVKPVLPVEEGYGYLRAAAAAAGANVIVISKQSRSDHKLVIAEGSFYVRGTDEGP